MKKFDLEEIAKNMWKKYWEKNEPPAGIPRDPIKHYGKDWKGWVYFLIKVYDKIEREKEQ